MRNRIAAALFALVALVTFAALADDPIRLGRSTDGVDVQAGPREAAERDVELNPLDRASRIPQSAVILDGVLYGPGQMPARHERLTFVLTKEDQLNGRIHAFTNRDSAADFMTQIKQRQQFASNFTCDNPYEWSKFNKDVGGGGSENLYMDYPYPYAHLDFGGWNNRISYVEAACVSDFTVLYSCRYYQMTTGTNCDDPDDLYVSPGLIISDLNWYGFNNRASSLRFCASSPNCN